MTGRNPAESGTQLANPLARLAKFAVNCLENREWFSGDEFAADWLHRQAVKLL